GGITEGKAFAVVYEIPERRSTSQIGNVSLGIIPQPTPPVKGMSAARIQPVIDTRDVPVVVLGSRSLEPVSRKVHTVAHRVVIRVGESLEILEHHRVGALGSLRDGIHHDEIGW